MEQNESVFSPATTVITGTGVYSSDAGMRESIGTPGSASGDSEVPKPGTDTAGDSLSASFDAMIKGEYKEEYDRRVRDTVRRRLKGQKEQFDRLSEEYNRLKADSEKRDTRSRADEIYSRWLREEAQTREKYPSLDLRQELSDPRFTAMLRSGVDVESAYTALHRDEIIPALMGHTADVVRRQMSEELQSGRNRPAENGMASKGAAAVMTSVASMTPADRAAIARRVARGERISF